MNLSGSVGAMLRLVAVAGVLSIVVASTDAAFARGGGGGHGGSGSAGAGMGGGSGGGHASGGRITGQTGQSSGRVINTIHPIIVSGGRNGRHHARHDRHDRHDRRMARHHHHHRHARRLEA